MMATEKRLIDANEVERKLRLCISSWCRDCNSNAPVIARTFEDALQRVIYAPTVDAVEVVRCKNCRFWNPRYETMGMCMKHNSILIFTKPDFYCAFGERKQK
jgi:hypothetical protein